jgi:hypothetical protein
MYAAIRQGKAKPGSAEEVSRRVREGAVPIISSTPGFKAFYLVWAEDTVTTFSIFEDKASADQSNARMLEWIKQNLAEFIISPVQASAGEVLVHQAG